MWCLTSDSLFVLREFKLEETEITCETGERSRMGYGGVLIAMTTYPMQL